VATIFNIGGGQFSVRPAKVGDAKAVRMLIPELSDAAATFVAVDAEHDLVIGAAAATRSVRRQPLLGPGVAVHVIVPCRRYGVGTALVRHLEIGAKRAGVTALFAARRVDSNSDEMRGWTGLGFAPYETVHEHSLPLEDFEPRLAPIVDHMRQRGRIPTEARIIPLYQATPGSVLQLHLNHLGGNRGELYRKLIGSGTGAFHPRYSRVLMVGEHIMGCILAHRADQDTAVVDADIVDPRLRGGWANVWLKLEATRGALQLGIKRFQFTTFDHYADTRSFSTNLGGEITRTTVLMMRPIKQPHAPAAGQGRMGNE
jgi:N-acetylglutamate synthase-like GNAT family acetyltransferase